MPQLRAALRTIHADRSWWSKILVGGALWGTLVGWPIVEGHQLESIENSQHGYPTPLPRWNSPGDKAVLGLFPLVIDFFYFVFPLLFGGLVLLCGSIATSLIGSGGAARVVAFGTLAAMALYTGGMWLAGASPIAKQRYVAEGDLGKVLEAGLVRELLRPPARSIYLRARLLSLPPYLVAWALLIFSLWLADRSLVAGLLAVWLGLSALVYARLVTIQLYLAATRAVESMRLDRLYQGVSRR